MTFFALALQMGHGLKDTLHGSSKWVHSAPHFLFSFKISIAHNHGVNDVSKISSAIAVTDHLALHSTHFLRTEVITRSSKNFRCLQTTFCAHLSNAHGSMTFPKFPVHTVFRNKVNAFKNLKCLLNRLCRSLVPPW